jgi:prepilin-type N-terminal cleavage/methylation domain-containing protein
MSKLKEKDKAVSIKLKSQLGFNLLELIVILAVIAILAAISFPRFFDFSDRASAKLLNAALAELSGREKIAFAEIKKSKDGWGNDQILFAQVNTDLGTAFHWSPKAKKNGGTLHHKNQKVKLERIPSTNTSAGKWIEKNKDKGKN